MASFDEVLKMKEDAKMIIRTNPLSWDAVMELKELIKNENWSLPFSIGAGNLKPQEDGFVEGMLHLRFKNLPILERLKKLEPQNNPVMNAIKTAVIEGIAANTTNGKMESFETTIELNPQDLNQILTGELVNEEAARLTIDCAVTGRVSAIDW